MTTLSIRKKNEVYITTNSMNHMSITLADYFTFEVPELALEKESQIQILMELFACTSGTGELYHGLMKHLQVWADERQYTIEYEKNDWYGDVSDDNKFVSLAGVKLLWTKLSAKN